jgi:hypothetical protein
VDFMGDERGDDAVDPGGVTGDDELDMAVNA